jgi:hypothetical protein
MLNTQLLLFIAFVVLPAFIASMFIVSLLDKRKALKQAKPKRKRRRLRLLTWLSSLIWEDAPVSSRPLALKPSTRAAQKTRRHKGPEVATGGHVKTHDQATPI